MNFSDISGYSAFIAIGIIAGFLFLWNRGLQRRLPHLSIFLIGIVGAAPFAVLGARLWTYGFDTNLNSLISSKENGWEGFVEFWGLSDGLPPQISGLSFHGAFLAGSVYTLVFFSWYGKKYSISVLELFDFVVPAVLILQIFGRFGNFFNQELLGEKFFTENYPQEWSWIPENIANSLKTTTDSGISKLRHPLFLYEIFANLCFLIIILILPNLLTLISFHRSDNFQTNKKVKAILVENKVPLRRGWWPKFFHWRWLTLQAYRWANFNKNREVWRKQLTPPSVLVTHHWYWARGPSFAKTDYQETARVIRKNPKFFNRYWQLFLLFFHRSSFNLTKWYKPFSTITLKSGTLTALYLIFYNSARFGLQFLRQSSDSMGVTFPTTIILISLGIIGFIFAQLIIPNRWRSANVRYETQY